MFGIKNFGQPGYAGSPLVFALTHPLANKISYFEEPSAEDCFEAAFFNNDEWVVDIIPELSLWAEDDFGSGTRVYRYIPKEVVYTFLVRFEERLDYPDDIL